MSISNDNVRIMVTLDKKTKEKLQIISKQEKRSLSNMSAKIITDYIKKEGIKYEIRNI